LATFKTRDGQSYKMPAGNVTKGALDCAFDDDCCVLECNGLALVPASNGVFVGTLPGHTYTVFTKPVEKGNKPTLFGRIGRKMLGMRHVPTREEVRKVFVHYDRDGSGAIDQAEFRALVASLGLLIPAEEVENTFKAIDLDNNGTIEFEEFFQWFHASKEHRNNPIRRTVRRMGQRAGMISITDPEVIRRAFMNVDADGNGEISPEEFQQCCVDLKLKVTPAEATQLFNAIDLDGNGALDFSEFLTWWRSMTRGDGKKTLLAHNIRHKLFEHASAELAALEITREKNYDDQLSGEGKWCLLTTLGKGWKHPDGGARLSQGSWFMKDGVVMLRGCLIGDNASSIIATLPEGVRPASTERFQVMSVTVKEGKPESIKCHPVQIVINPDGTITANTTYEGELWLSGVSFTLA